MNKKVLYVYKYYFKGIKKAVLKTISSTLGYIHTGNSLTPISLIIQIIVITSVGLRESARTILMAIIKRKL